MITSATKIVVSYFRFYSLIWGAILSGVFVLIPTFKHLRVLCIVGLVGEAPLISFRVLIFILFLHFRLSHSLGIIFHL